MAEKEPKKTEKKVGSKKAVAKQSSKTEKKIVSIEEEKVPKKRGRKPKEPVLADNAQTEKKSATSDKKTNRKEEIKPKTALKIEPNNEETLKTEKTEEKVDSFNRPEEMKKPVKKASIFHTSEVVVLVLLTAIIGIAMGILICRPILKQQEKETINDTLNDPVMREFLKNYQYVIDNYYGKIDKKQLLDGAIEGMIGALGDEHSIYLDKDENSTFNLTLQGSYHGVGIQVTNRLLTDGSYGNIYILKVFENSSASKAGVQAGDEVISIDGKDMKGKLYSDLSTYIKDSDQKKFELGILRNGQEKKITVSKETIEIQSVYAKTYTKNNKKIGYLKINIFAQNTADQFASELEKLEKSGIQSLIIDVRDNAGGHLSAVSDMLSNLLDKTHIIYQTQNKEGVKKFYSTGKTTKKYPIAVITNTASASASEVLAGALSEEYGATLVGETTYGKGTVQQLMTLSDDNEYKFTTKNWLTPKGIWVNGIGLKPDVALKPSEEYLKNPTEANDNQLQKAIDILANK